MKSKLKYLIYLVLQSWTLTGFFALAQTPKRMGPASADEIKKALTALETNMDSYGAHKAYIYAMGMENPDLFKKYEMWIKKYPRNLNIPLAIATVYNKASMPQPESFLLNAVAIDSGNANGWAMLADDAFARGQDDLVTEYSRKAMLLDPQNADYAYAFLRSFENGDLDKYKNQISHFIMRFPTDERGAAAIYRLGQRATDLKEKIRYFEELRKLYPTQKFKWAASRLEGLVDAYLQTDPVKALLLINETEKDHDWTTRKHVAESLIEISKLEQSQNYTDAIHNIDQIKHIGSRQIGDFTALKKASLLEKSGDIKRAYDGLSIKFARLPGDEFYNALELYGKKLGKNKEQVLKDIEIIRVSEAVAAPPFKLGLYTGSDTLDLAALKGKVILLTFWFPSCGPCKAEFPHFQTVVDSFKDDDLVYIGINTVPSQDGFVLSFVKNNKYSFIPLRGSLSFAKETYGVSGAPTNFVIDKQGMIVFKDFTIDSSNHRTLEYMLSSLLEKK